MSSSLARVVSPMRLIFSAVSIAVVLAALTHAPHGPVAPATSSAAPVPNHLMPPAPLAPKYYPTVVGTTWVLESAELLDGEPREVRYEVVRVEVEGGATIVTVDYVTTSGYKGSVPMQVSAAGVFELMSGGERTAAPIPVLRTPVKAGDTWDTPRAWLKSCKQTVAGVEAVTVPAGTFDAVRVDERSFDGCCSNTRTRWYAPGIGLVKKYTPGGGTEALKSFTPGPVK